MYGTYGSYSSMCERQMPSPLDILSSPSRSQASDAVCAFPSWPRRSSLSHDDLDDAAPTRASSYLSDEDLFWPSSSSTIEDDARSVSSTDSASASPATTAFQQQQAAAEEAALAEKRREREAYQRMLVRHLQEEKERRRAAARTQRSNSTSSRRGSMRKSPKGSKLVNMTPIAEGGE